MRPVRPLEAGGGQLRPPEAAGGQLRPLEAGGAGGGRWRPVEAAGGRWRPAAHLFYLSVRKRKKGMVRQACAGYSDVGLPLGYLWATSGLPRGHKGAYLLKLSIEKQKRYGTQGETKCRL